MFSETGYSISSDKKKLDLVFIHQWLSGSSYWAKKIPFEIVEKSVRYSLCFGVYFEDRQIGFARVTTDFATFAYIADVFIIEEFRGKGLSKRLMETILAHPELQGLRRWVLATLDAHGLYEKSGFRPLKNPQRFMEINEPEIYMRRAEQKNTSL